MTRRRRGKRGRNSPSPPAKRLRGGLPEPIPVPTPAPAVAGAPHSALVMVAGLPPGCGVMALKSRLEAYGPISRARVDAAAATGYVAFRSGAAAVAAITASLDPHGGIAIGSKKKTWEHRRHPSWQKQQPATLFAPEKVLVVQASEAPISSKNVVPATDSAGHHAMTKNAAGNSVILNSKATPEVSCKAREMVAYDDLF